MSQTHRSRTGFVRGLAASGVLALALTGCAADNAATTSTSVVTDSEASIAAQQYAEMTGGGASLTGVVNALAQAEIFLPVMTSHGIVPTDAEVDEFVEAQGWQQPQEPMADSTRTVLRSMAAFDQVQELGAEEQTQLAQNLNEALGRENVEMNPRYALSPDRFPILPTWISTTTRTSDQQAPQPAPAG